MNDLSGFWKYLLNIHGNIEKVKDNTTRMTIRLFSAPTVAVQLMLKFEKVVIQEFNLAFD